MTYEKYTINILSTNETCLGLADLLLKNDNSLTDKDTSIFLICRSHPKVSS